MNTLWAVDEVPFSSWILFILHLRPLTVSQCEQYKIFYKRGFISLISIQQIKQSKKKEKKKKVMGGLALLSGCICSDFTAQPKLKGEKRKRNKNLKHRSSPDIHKGSTHGHLWQETIEIWEKRNNIYKQVRTLPTWLLWGSVQCRLGSGLWGIRGVGVRLERLVEEVEGQRRGEARGWGEVEIERRAESTLPFGGLLQLLAMLWKHWA